MTHANTLKGGCHCGTVSFEIKTDKDETGFTPRTCSCSLCQKHGASWISDPEGVLELQLSDKDNVSFYRFGHKTSDFIVCKTCGVLAVALCEFDDTTRAVINIKAMPDHVFTNEPANTNFDTENVDERLDRRKRNWTGKVVITS